MKLHQQPELPDGARKKWVTPKCYSEHCFWCLVKISEHLYPGTYVPLTLEGRILVDSVLASCYGS